MSRLDTVPWNRGQSPKLYTFYHKLELCTHSVTGRTVGFLYHLGKHTNEKVNIQEVPEGADTTCK